MKEDNGQHRDGAQALDVRAKSLLWLLSKPLVIVTNPVGTLPRDQVGGTPAPEKNAGVPSARLPIVKSNFFVSNPVSRMFARYKSPGPVATVAYAGNVRRRYPPNHEVPPVFSLLLGQS
jgi:hypothetical protein